jgi:hypothetical protein
VLRYNRIDLSVETLTICFNKLGCYAARLDGSGTDEHKAWAAKLVYLKALCDRVLSDKLDGFAVAPYFW